MIRKLIVVVMLAIVAACGPKLPPGTSPEATMAVRATQVVAALRATLPQIKANVCVEGSDPRVCIKPADAIKVVNHVENAGGYAEQLGQALAIVDSAKTVTEQTAGMEKARTLLTHIQGLLTQASVAPENEGARNAVVTLMGTVTTLLFSISTF